MSDDEKAIDPQSRELAELLAIAGSSTACPFCPNKEWHLAQQADGGRFHANFLQDQYGFVAPLSYVLVCTNCGFERRHSPAFLNRNRLKKPDNE